MEAETQPEPGRKNKILIYLIIGAVLLGAITIVWIDFFMADPAALPVAADETVSAEKPVESEIQYVEPTNYIDSLDAKVIDFKFFESGYDDTEFIEYDNSFSRLETRYINWEMRVVHPASDQDRSVKIIHKYYRPTGVIEHVNQSTLEFPADWTETWQTWGYGYDEPGRWRTGTYYVEVLIDNVVVAAGSFDIY